MDFDIRDHMKWKASMFHFESIFDPKIGDPFTIIADMIVILRNGKRYTITAGCPTDNCKGQKMWIILIDNMVFIPRDKAKCLRLFKLMKNDERMVSSHTSIACASRIREPWFAYNFCRDKPKLQ